MRQNNSGIKEEKDLEDAESMAFTDQKSKRAIHFSENNTTAEIKLDILSGLYESQSFANQIEVKSFEVTKGHVYFKVMLPDNRSVMRRVDQFKKFRNILAVKWAGFLPLQQCFDLKTNEIKLFMLNQFMKDVCKYKFILDSKEFKTAFDSSQKYISMQDFDQSMKPLFDEAKMPGFVKDQYERF